MLLYFHANSSQLGRYLQKKMEKLSNLVPSPLSSHT